MLFAENCNIHESILWWSLFRSFDISNCSLKSTFPHGLDALYSYLALFIFEQWTNCQTFMLMDSVVDIFRQQHFNKINSSTAILFSRSLSIHTHTHVRIYVHIVYDILTFNNDDFECFRLLFIRFGCRFSQSLDIFIIAYMYQQQHTIQMFTIYIV